MLAGVSAALIALILIVFFMAFGFGLLGFALSVFWSLIWYSIVGLVIGGLARLVVSGRQELGCSAGSSRTTSSTWGGSDSS
jgi:hypothetical protein